MLFSDKLILLPLFQGMSRNDIDNVLGIIRFGFETCSRKHIIADQHMPSKRLIFVVEGMVDVETRNDDGTFCVKEQIEAPCMIELDRLFGLRQHYSHKYIAHSKCQIVSISKEDILKLAANFLIFRLNLLNQLSTYNHKLQMALWLPPATNIEQRIMRFLKQHCITPYGTKVFHTKMTTLAEFINDSRMDVSKALNSMESQGLIILQRGIITVKDIENFTV